MRRAGRWLGVLLVLVGLFWAGRESTHGIHAFWEHWWCILPVVSVVIGAVGVVLSRRPSPAG